MICLFFLGTLVSVIGLIQMSGQDWQDRYLYLPAIEIVVTTAWGGSAVAGYWRRRSITLTITLLGFLALTDLGIATHRQVRYWQNSDTICSDIAKENPGT